MKHTRSMIDILGSLYYPIFQSLSRLYFLDYSPRISYISMILNERKSGAHVCVYDKHGNEVSSQDLVVKCENDSVDVFVNNKTHKRKKKMPY